MGRHCRVLYASENIGCYVLYFLTDILRCFDTEQREGDSKSLSQITMKTWKKKKCFDCFPKLLVKLGFKDLVISHSGCITHTPYCFTAYCRWQAIVQKRKAESKMEITFLWSLWFNNQGKIQGWQILLSGILYCTMLKSFLLRVKHTTAEKENVVNVS